MTDELNSAQRKELHSQLLRWRSDLRCALRQRESAAATVELDQARQGRLSRMDALQGQAMEQASATRARTDLRRIAVALERLASGDYGCCEDCGASIGAARLLIDPAVDCCVACATARESA